jgi:hypothetical protein
MCLELYECFVCSVNVLVCTGYGTQHTCGSEVINLPSKLRPPDLVWQRSCGRSDLDDSYHGNVLRACSHCRCSYRSRCLSKSESIGWGQRLHRYFNKWH